MARGDIVVWGGGGHGKVVAELCRLAGYHVVGFVDSDPAKFGEEVEPGGARVIFIEDEMLERTTRSSEPTSLPRLALGVGDNHRRFGRYMRIADHCTEALVHPAAVVSRSASLGRATVVFAGCMVSPDARVGEAVILNTGCIVEHDCNIEAGAHISPGAVLTGGVRVGECSWVGAGATVLPGRAIGSDAIVGAGAVVIEDVPDGVVVVGNPARPLPGRSHRIDKQFL